MKEELQNKKVLATDKEVYIGVEVHKGSWGNLFCLQESLIDSYFGF